MQLRKMFKELGTPDGMKVEKAFPNAGDHVIGSRLRSKDVKSVYEATDAFFQEELHMKPVEAGILQP